jgi:hypothetical protein
MEKPNNPPSATPSPAFSLLKSDEPSPDQVDALYDALTEVAIQQSLDESRPEDHLALAQAAVGAFEPPKHQFSHNAEDGEEAQKLIEEDMGMEVLENKNEDNDTEMTDANHFTESPRKIDPDSESDPVKNPKNNRGVPPFSGGCQDNDLDRDDFNSDGDGDETPKGSGDRKPRTLVNRTSTARRITRSRTTLKNPVPPKSKSKPPTRKTESRGITKPKPKTKPIDAPKNPFAGQAFPLMEDPAEEKVIEGQGDDKDKGKTWIHTMLDWSRRDLCTAILSVDWISSPVIPLLPRLNFMVHFMR